MFVLTRNGPFSQTTTEMGWSDKGPKGTAFGQNQGTQIFQSVCKIDKEENWAAICMSIQPRNGHSRIPFLTITGQGVWPICAIFPNCHNCVDEIVYGFERSVKSDAV